LGHKSHDLPRIKPISEHYARSAALTRAELLQHPGALRQTPQAVLRVQGVVVREAESSRVRFEIDGIEYADLSVEDEEPARFRTVVPDQKQQNPAWKLDPAHGMSLPEVFEAGHSLLVIVVFVQAEVLHRENGLGDDVRADRHQEWGVRCDPHWVAIVNAHCISPLVW